MAKTVLKNTTAKFFGEFLFDIYKAAVAGFETVSEYHPVSLQDYTPAVLDAQALVFKTMSISVKMDDGTIVYGPSLSEFVNELLTAVLAGKRIAGSDSVVKMKFIKSVPLITTGFFEQTLVEVDIVDGTPVGP